MAGILEDIRIVDMSDGIAGAVAAMLLAESGADVVLVEPPEGNPLRTQAGFRTWHRSKRSVLADLDEPEGRARLHSLLSSADVLIHQMPPSRAEAAGIDDESLARRHPHLIPCSVLGWPLNHPDADRPVDELLVMARLGICDEQLPMGRNGPDLHPVPARDLGGHLPGRVRHRRSPPRSATFRPGGTGAHQPGAGRARADGHALVEVRNPLRAPGPRDAQGRTGFAELTSSNARTASGST